MTSHLGLYRFETLYAIYISVYAKYLNLVFDTTWSAGSDELPITVG